MSSLVGQEVSICTYKRRWVKAQIVGEGLDSFMAERRVLIVRHPAFMIDLEFYAEPEDGFHNSAQGYVVWLVARELE